MAKLPGTAGAGRREAPALQLTLFSASRAHLQSSDLQVLFFFFFLRGNRCLGRVKKRPQDIH